MFCYLLDSFLCLGSIPKTKPRHTLSHCFNNSKNLADSSLEFVNNSVFWAKSSAKIRQKSKLPTFFWEKIFSTNKRILSISNLDIICGQKKYYHGLHLAWFSIANLSFLFKIAHYWRYLFVNNYTTPWTTTINTIQPTTQPHCYIIIQN